MTGDDAGRPFSELRLTAAEAAGRIRRDLRNAFPGESFTVRVDRLAAGSSIYVHYTDGPPIATVEKLVGAYGGRRGDGDTAFTPGSLRLTSQGPAVVTHSAFVRVIRSYSTEGLATIVKSLGRASYQDVSGSEAGRVDLRILPGTRKPAG